MRSTGEDHFSLLNVLFHITPLAFLHGTACVPTNLKVNKWSGLHEHVAGAKAGNLVATKRGV